MVEKIDEKLLLTSPRFIEQREYWIDQLSGAEGETALFPIDKTSSLPVGTMETREIRIPGDLAQKLLHISNRADLSLYIILLTALKILIYRYSGNNDIVVISPVYEANRWEETRNDFLLIRTRAVAEKTFKEMVIQVKSSVLGAYENQDYPLQHLIKFLYESGRIPGQGIGSTVLCTSNSLHSRTKNQEEAKGKVIFSLQAEEGAIGGYILYDPGTYENHYMEQISKHFTRILEVAVENVNVRLSHIRFLSREEQEELLYTFNNNEADFSRDRTIVEWVEGIATRSPQRTALDFNGSETTYGELVLRVNTLVKTLVHHGIQRDQPVGILLERSTSMVESILAVWKAGGAYIPLDTRYPLQRLTRVLEDSRAAVLITESRFITPGLEGEYAGSIINLDSPHHEDQPGALSVPHLENHMHSCAYIIYTSGSTGIPKGVMVEHIGMVNHIQAKTSELQLNETSIVAQNASHTFDISVWQLFAALTLGGKIVIYSNQLVLEPQAFIQRVIDDRVTILEVVPSYLSVLLDYFEEQPGLVLPLQYLLVTGETLKPGLVKRWFAAYPGIKMVNAYGPTEASDDITHYIMDKAGESIRIPIGSPLQNFNIYIVDENMNLCPIGVIGQVCVSGIGVGRGYLNNPGLTNSKFQIANKKACHQQPHASMPSCHHASMHQPSPHSPIYRTGDMGRWLRDGTIEFFGREDHQVKIRGYRIELQEIENQLLRQPPVKQAVVIDREDTPGGKYLCAYLVSDGTLIISDLEKHLARYLPEYMIPGYIVQLQQIPLTSNGKVDRHALPRPGTGSPMEMTYLTEEMLGQVVAVTPGNYMINKNILLPEENTHRLSEKEREQILYSFNDTVVVFPWDQVVHELFQEQMVNIPDRTAVVFEEKQLTYGELRKRSSKLASVLKGKGIKPGDIVGIMVERSLVMITGLMALLEAGAAYLPIDSFYPPERIKYMIEDSQPRLVLTQSQFLTNFKCDIVDMDDSKNYPEEVSQPACVNCPTDLAYIMYTSGSTGKPKAVMIQHNHLVNIAFAWRKVYHLQEMEFNLLQIANFSFDVSSGDYIKTFCNGGRLIICPFDAAAEPVGFYNYLRKFRVTMFESTPGIIVPLMEYSYENGLAIDSLKLVIMGSETCHVEDFKRLVSRFGKIIRFINSYGVTEATIDSSYYEENRADNIPVDRNLSIGKPLPNMKLYVLNVKGDLQPVGVTGELYISGRSVARGYLNRVESTHDRFSPDPFDPRGEMMMYKTGDLARWFPGGDMEFLGRMDNQVNINGIRVEPGEIESFLVKHQHVTEAVVLPKGENGGNIELYAFVVSRKRLMEGDLREYLGGELPIYMIPSYFIQLEKMPLTANKKVDRHLLAAVEPGRNTRDSYLAPENEIEEKLAVIWAEVLNIKKEIISTHTSFFELGGHSLKIIQLVAEIHKHLEVKIPIVEVFKTSTIKGLAKYIKDAAAEKFVSVKVVEKREFYALSPAQKRMYFMQQLQLESTAYNITQICPLAEKPGEKKLENTFNQLIQRHESLRTSFEMVDGKIVQRIHDDAALEIEYYPVKLQDQAEEVIKGFVRPFDLSRLPLLRVGLIHIPAPFSPGGNQNQQNPGDRYILLVDMPHIISDGISQGILVKDFMSLYEGQGLPPLRLHYRDYSQWQNSGLQKQVVKEQEEYWKRMFAGDIPVLNLPIDYERPETQDLSGDRISFRIDNEENAALGKLTLDEGVTLFMLMLVTCNILLARISGQEDIVVGSDVSGRRHADLQDIIGMFINMLALRNRPGGNKTFKEFLSEVKANTLSAFDNQDYPYDELVGKLGLQGDFSRNPLFNVVLSVRSIGISATPTNAVRANKKKSENDSLYRTVQKASQFDLIFGVVENPGNITVNLEYATSLFKKATAEKIARHFQNIVKQVVTDPGIKLQDIDVHHGVLMAGSTIFDQQQSEFEF